jgi:hypothetical protein
MKLFHIKTLTSRGPNEMDDEIDIKSEYINKNNLFKNSKLILII